MHLADLVASAGHIDRSVVALYARWHATFGPHGADPIGELAARTDLRACGGVDMLLTNADLGEVATWFAEPGPRLVLVAPHDPARAARVLATSYASSLAPGAVATSTA